MVNERNVLKQHLIRTRAEITLDGVYPVCPFCGDPIYPGRGDGPDLHEAIISRGESRGNARLQQEILTSPYNCVLVHHAEHIDKGDTKENDDKAILQLLEHYGVNLIIHWLNSLKTMTKGRLVDDKIRRVEALAAQ